MDQSSNLRENQIAVGVGVLFLLAHSSFMLLAICEFFLFHKKNILDCLVIVNFPTVFLFHNWFNGVMDEPVFLILLLGLLGGLSWLLIGWRIGRSMVNVAWLVQLVAKLFNMK